MYTIDDIKAAHKALEEAKNKPLDHFYTREESFFDDAPETREEAKEQLIKKREAALKQAFANVADQKAKDEYIAQHGLEATVI